MNTYIKLALRGLRTNWAYWACCLILFTYAVYSLSKYGYVFRSFGQHPFYEVLLWDSQVFSNGGEMVAQGHDPYALPAVFFPFELPFFSAPAVAETLGLLYHVFGANLAVLLKLGHVIAMILTPLILTRMFIGRSLSEVAWGYGLFLVGIGTSGVLTILAGNFGALLYLAVFAAMGRGFSTGRWFWFHVAVAVAVQVKPPYGMLWIVPILSNGWNWRQTLQTAIAAAAAAGAFLVSYLINPDLFQRWLNALVGNIERDRDFGSSFYGAARGMIGIRPDSMLPYALHVGMCVVLLAFLLRDKTKGKMKGAALIAFAIIANPRMKDYDVAFAVIPVVGLMCAALVPLGGSNVRRASAVVAVTLALIAWHGAIYVPILGAYSYALVVVVGILSVAFMRPRAVEGASVL